MGERLTPVTDFAQLRPSLLLVCKACGNCGADHRVMLLNYTQHPPFCDGFEFEPVPACFPEHPASYVIAPIDVATGHIFLVDTGLEDSQQSPATVSKRKGVRA